MGRCIGGCDHIADDLNSRPRKGTASAYLLSDIVDNNQRYTAARSAIYD